MLIKTTKCCWFLTLLFWVLFKKVYLLKQGSLFNFKSLFYYKKLRITKFKNFLFFIWRKKNCKFHQTILFMLSRNCFKTKRAIVIIIK